MAVAYLLGGGAVSGKSTLAAAIKRDNYPNIVYVMPENMDDTIPNFVLERDHEKSAHLTRNVLASVIRGKQNLLLDYAMAGSKDKDFIYLLINNGYIVHLLFVDVPIDKAIERAVYRGRGVPENVIRDFHFRSAANFTEFRFIQGIDSIRLYDNTKELKLVYLKEHGSVFINDQQCYMDVIVKGEMRGDGSGYHLFNSEEDINDLEDMLCGR